MLDTGKAILRGSCSAQFRRSVPARRSQLRGVMHDVLQMLLGGSLVTLGVLTSALADRVRQLRPARHVDATPAREPRELVREPSRAPRQPAPIDLAPGSGAVVAALVAAGFKKTIAAQAVAACSPRDQATPESWTAAALRRCALGGVQ
jgi:hypothetical protein